MHISNKDRHTTEIATNVYVMKLGSTNEKYMQIMSKIMKKFSELK